MDILNDGKSNLENWPGHITAVIIFAEDLDVTKHFYQVVFGLPIHYEDKDSAVFKFGEMLINLLRITEANELIEPAKIADRNAGSRQVFSLNVENVDAMCDELRKRGVEILNGPMDRPWGLRTASFINPAGCIWEISQ